MLGECCRVLLCRLLLVVRPGGGSCGDALPRACSCKHIQRKWQDARQDSRGNGNTGIWEWNCGTRTQGGEAADIVPPQDGLLNILFLLFDLPRTTLWATGLCAPPTE